MIILGSTCTRCGEHVDPTGDDDAAQNDVRERMVKHVREIHPTIAEVHWRMLTRAN